jgi:hypothetical protein
MRLQWFLKVYVNHKSPDLFNSWLYSIRLVQTGYLLVPDRVAWGQLARPTPLQGCNLDGIYITVCIDCAICIILASDVSLP